MACVCVSLEMGAQINSNLSSIAVLHLNNASSHPLFATFFYTFPFPLERRRFDHGRFYWSHQWRHGLDDAGCNDGSSME